MNSDTNSELFVILIVLTLKILIFNTFNKNYNNYHPNYIPIYICFLNKLICSKIFNLFLDHSNSTFEFNYQEIKVNDSVQSG